MKFTYGIIMQHEGKPWELNLKPILSQYAFFQRQIRIIPYLFEKTRMGIQVAHNRHNQLKLPV